MTNDQKMDPHTTEGMIGAQRVTQERRDPSDRWLAIPFGILSRADLPASLRIAALLAFAVSDVRGRLTLDTDALARRAGVTPREYLASLNRLVDLEVLHVARDEHGGIVGVREGRSRERRAAKAPPVPPQTTEALSEASGGQDALFDISAFDEGDPADRFTPTGGDGRPWHRQLAEVWTREIGAMHPGRLGKALRPVFRLAPDIDKWARIVDFYAAEARLQNRLGFATPERLASFGSVYLALFDDANPQQRLAILTDPNWKAPV